MKYYLPKGGKLSSLTITLFIISASDSWPLDRLEAGCHGVVFGTSLTMMRLDAHGTLLSAGLATSMISERVVALVPRAGRIPRAGRPRPRYGC